MDKRGMGRQGRSGADDRYRAIFDAANDAIFVYDADTFCIIDVNEAVRPMYGYEPDELRGHFGPISAGDPPYSLEDGLRWMQRARSQGPQRFEWLSRTKDGRQFWVEVQIKRAKVKGGDVLLAVVRDVTQRKAMEQALQDSERRLRRHNAALTSLARRLQSAAGNIREIIRDVTETSARTLDVERVGVWLLDEDGTVLRCMDLFERSAGAHTAGAELRVDDYPNYFAALQRQRTVAAHDAMHDPRTREFTESYLVPLGITSMLDAPIRVGGRLVGVVCHEHVGARRRWSLDEQNFAASISDLLSLAFETWQRLQTEHDLRASERRFREMAALLPDVIYEMDDNFRFTYGNKAAIEVLGYGPRDFEAGLGIRDVVLPAEADRAIARLVEAGRTGKPTVGTYRLRCKDGTIIPFEVHSVAIRDDAGRVVGYRGVARDIREREKVQEAQRMAAVGQIAAGVAHEFNNILAAILGRAELARAAGTPEAYERLVETAMEAGSRGAEICRSLLQFARPAEPRREPVLVEDALEAALSMAQSQILRSNVTVHRRYGTGNRQILGDLGQLEQVFLNLILNACDAMAPEGGRLTVATEYTRRRGKGMVVVRITDTGPGISPEALPRIFDPFFTTKMGDGHADRPGAGLGLSVSRSIVRAHGGEIEAFSEPGRGATFAVRFPEAAEDSRPPELARAEERPEEAAGRRGTVLLVEDERSVRDVLQEVLEAQGYSVLAASTTAEALDLLGAKRCDAVVADIVMAGGGAREILKRVEGLDPRPPVVVVTGLVQPEIVEQMRRLGAAKCLQKPFTTAELLGALDEVTKVG